MLLSQLLNPEVRIQNVSIAGRGNTAGFVEFDADSQRSRRMTRKEVKEDLIILLGGRAAQMLKFGEDGIDAGVADDLAKARELARLAIEAWGMDDQFPTSDEAKESSFGDLSRVSAWLSEASCSAARLLQENQSRLDRMAAAMMDGRDVFETAAGLEIGKP